MFWIIDNDTISSENSDTDTVPIDTKGKFAEDDVRLINTVKIPNSLIINTENVKKSIPILYIIVHNIIVNRF